jgi:acyl transferase domain-containing protein/acyl carrier protein
MGRNEVESALLKQVARILGESADKLDPARSLSELGLDSVGYATVSSFVKKKFGVAVPPETLFEFSSVEATAAHVADLIEGKGQPAQPAPAAAPAVARVAADATYSDRDIAIVGMACRLPGANSVDEYWDLIRGGTSMIREFPARRGPSAGADPGYLKGGFVEDVDAFDAAFFGISRREALAMDPQQRLFLECAWQAFENAGYATTQLSGSTTAVFVGVSSFDYYELLLRTQAARTTHIGSGMSHAVLANRVSQFFNLKGASEAIDTACSSGLVALWRAVETLRRGESELALVGGVNVLASRTLFQVFADASMLSPEGACRPFAAGAAGYVRGEGVAAVLVKRAADAVRDGDRIWAVIKGGAVRHSGRTNSLTAPNPDAQAEVIVGAVADAGIDPLSIGYVEAHGTGTPLGDPIEVNGLKRAFRRLHTERGRTDVAPHFTVGSVKAQIGHLEAAAGMAGLLKAVLALNHGAIPGSPYLTEINPHIDLADACFRFSPEHSPWPEPALPGQPRRAGVSSFGFGGVNAHVVLEERPAAAPRTSTGAGNRLFVLSAKTADALRARASALAAMLASKPFANGEEQIALGDLAFTLRRKTPLAHRLAIVAGSAAELSEQLRQWPQGAPDSVSGIAQATTHEAMGLFSSEAEVEERLRALAASGELRKLAALWVKGFAIEWDRVLPRAGAALVTTPDYPFARESYWVTFGNGDTSVAAPYPAAAPAPVAALRSAAAPARWALYSEAWVERPFGDGDARDLQAQDDDKQGAVIALVSGPTGRRVAELMERGRRVVIAAWPDAGTAEALLSSAGRISGLLDLTSLDGEVDQTSEAARNRLDLVRQLIGTSLKKGERVDVVLATLGLQRAGARSVPETLAGAQEAGLYKSLWAEYRRCRSKTVDFDPAGFTAENTAAALAREIDQHDGPGEIAWVGDTRMARTIEPVRLTLSPPAREPDGVAMITGGTGAIGLALARDLAARGFRALLLTGRRELTADQNRVVEGLTRQGVSISFYRGDLCDEASLGAAVKQFRAAHGRITHVYHCAGAVSQAAPAFFQKTAASMADVLRPKVDALWVLHRLLAGGPPRVFILFSSVSAVAPKLASGVLDYAAANRFLDLFAQYQHARGQTQYRSIQWARWRQMGLARDVREDGAAGTALDAEQCFDALHRVEAAEGLGPVVCVAAEGTAMLTASALERGAIVEQAQSATTATPVADGGQRLEVVRRELRTIVAKELEVEESTLGDEARFDELGIDSIVLIGIVGRIEKWLGTKVDPSELIKGNSIAAVARYLADLHLPGPDVLSQPPVLETAAAAAAPAATPTAAIPAPMPPPATSPPIGAPMPSAPRHAFPVAVIGIACRFPGAVDKETFWRNLAGGLDSVSTVPASRWDAQAFYARRHEPGKTVSQWGGFIDDVERVNPSLFGLGPEEAADLDPLIRLFTETSLAAVLDSPYDHASLKGRRVGVFAGARAGRYAERIVSPTKHSVVGVGQNFIAAFVSHVLDLRGPSLVLDSACSSSLAAVHLACLSLQSGDSEMAIAGGVDLLLDEKSYLFLSAAHALSPDGRCRTFDEKANGFVPGEGVGCVLLKPLGQAMADGDHVYAVIDGSAINNDGRTLGVTTPGVEGQVDVIERAWQKAGAPLRSVSYVEAHGTGTMIGDPIELRALARAFAADPPAHCAIGSVKTNVGHLLSAAGIASFIKVALALHHRTLPPTLHCEQVNPRFEFERTPFRPVVEARPWEVQAGVRRAGISAFGFGKTNVHVVVSERPPEARRPVDLSAAKAAVADGDKVYAWRSPAPVSAASPQLLALEAVSCETLAEA